MSSIDQTVDIPPVGEAAVFAVGGVMGKTFSIFGRRFLPFIVISGVMMLPYLVVLLTNHDYAASQRDGSSLFAGQRTFTISLLLPLLLAFLTTITEGVLIQAVFMDIGGRTVDVGFSIRRGLRRSISLMAITILQSVGTFIGGMLLLVPGIILFTMWFVADAVCVIEGLPAVRSVNRSTALTRGHRWKVLGIALLSVLVLFVSEIIVNAIAPSAGETAWAIASYLLQSFYLPISAILITVIYHDLRAAKEGLGIERISAVFD